MRVQDAARQLLLLCFLQLLSILEREDEIYEFNSVMNQWNWRAKLVLRRRHLWPKSMKAILLSSVQIEAGLSSFPFSDGLHLSVRTPPSGRHYSIFISYENSAYFWYCFPGSAPYTLPNKLLQLLLLLLLLLLPQFLHNSCVWQKAQFISGVICCERSSAPWDAICSWERCVCVCVCMWVCVAAIQCFPALLEYSYDYVRLITESLSWISSSLLSSSSISTQLLGFILFSFFFLYGSFFSFLSGFCCFAYIFI